MEENQWYEELPEACPPTDAEAPVNRIFYRVAKGNPTTDSDFFSQRKLAPEKIFNAEECIARAVSIFEAKEDAARYAKLPNFHGGNMVAEIKLNESDGVIKKTSKKSHYSWWRTKSFNFATSIIVEI